MSINKTITKIGIFTGLGAVLYGVYKFYKYQFQLALEYCYKIYDFKIQKFTKDRVTIDLFVKFQNKSSFAFLINGYELDVIINGKDVGTVKSKEQQMLYNNSVSSLSLTIDFIPTKFFNLADAVQLALYYITDKSKIIVNLKGNFNAEMNFIKIKMPLDLTFTMQDLISTDPEAESKKTKCDIK